MKLHYKTLGSGKPILILHGLYGSSDNWVHIGKRLSLNHQVYLLDQRNHGRSPHVATHTYEDLREDLKNFVEEKQLQDITLIGHSMGGKAAMFYALAYPERISNLIIGDISPRDYNLMSGKLRRISNHEQFLKGLITLDLTTIANRRDAEKALLREIPDIQVCRFLLKNLKRISANQFEWKINLPVINANLTNMLKGLSGKSTYESRKPVLFIRAEKSRYILEDDYFLIRKYFPNADIVSVPNAGHWIHVEQPDLLVKTIRYFMS